MNEKTPSPAVRQLRLIVKTDDFAQALNFYRDELGLAEQAAFTGEGDAKVAILHAGAATLEIANSAQVDMIDQVEADGQPSAAIRVAFEVDDSTQKTEQLVNAGAELKASPRETPWKSINSRMHAPGDLEITLFSELETLNERSQRPGFQKP